MKLFNLPVVRTPMIIVVRITNLIPLPWLPTLFLKWVAIITQIVTMAMVGRMKARLAAVHTQIF